MGVGRGLTPEGGGGSRWPALSVSTFRVVRTCTQGEKRCGEVQQLTPESAQRPGLPGYSQGWRSNPSPPELPACPPVPF